MYVFSRPSLTIKLIIILLGTLILLQGLLSQSDVEKSKLVERQVNINLDIYSTRVWEPDYGSRTYRRDCRYFLNSLYEVSKKKGDDSFGNFSEGDKPTHINIIDDKIKISEEVQKNKSKIDCLFIYEIKDDFKKLTSIFKVGYNIYFLLKGAIGRENGKFDGIFRLNEDKWYELITGTRFNFAADLGKNRVLGYYIGKAIRLYGFKQNFRDDFYIDLPDFRFRQALYKLSDRKFLFHNFRANPYDHAVEIYGLDGKRIKEFFNYVPSNLKQKYLNPLAYQTVLTTDKKGHFYIAFQYPLNPYRIWKYDENGKKLKVFGNYFADPGVYESPEEWIRLSFKEIEYYGIRHIYAVNKLLIDSEGRLLIFFSKNRIIKKHRGKDVQQYFIDIYSKDGEFIGRQEFKYGFPELIDKDIIYSRVKGPSRTWEITVVRLSIK